MTDVVPDAVDEIASAIINCREIVDINSIARIRLGIGIYRKVLKSTGVTGLNGRLFGCVLDLDESCEKGLVEVCLRDDKRIEFSQLNIGE